MEHSLIISHNGTPVFTSDQHWLHPLFEFEDFLSSGSWAPGELFLSDKIAGKAAACLIVYLGVRRCHIELLSERAIPVFRANGIEFTYDRLVEHIQCRTEDLITDSMSIADSYLFLRKRAGRVKGVNLKLDHISVRYGDTPVLDKLSLELSRGEQMIIHGANGCGKTTLLRAVLGLVPPSEGEIRVGEYRVGSREWRIRRNISAYVHQETIKNSFPITASEVVRIGLGKAKLSSSESQYRIELAMRRTGSFHLAGQLYSNLSGGEKQRVSLARCLCQDAGVFLLDEPTSFLDPQGREDLLTLLLELSRNEAPTMILVSHDAGWSTRLGWPVRELKGGKLC